MYTAKKFMNYKQDKHKGICISEHHGQILKTKSKEKILESSRGKGLITYSDTANLNNLWLLIRNNRGLKAAE